MSSYCENLKDMTWFPRQKTKAESWRGKLDSNNSPIIYLWWAELMTLAILGRKQLNSHFEATLMQSLVRSPEKISQKFKMKAILKASMWVRDQSSRFAFCTAQRQRPALDSDIWAPQGSTRISRVTLPTPQDHYTKFKPNLFQQPRTCLE